MDHDTRDLDGVIDEVAQAMTGAELRRDLRPAVAARMAGGPSWTFEWRVAAAATAIASVVLAVLVMRSGGEAEKTTLPAPVATVEQTPRVESAQPVLATVLPLEVRAVRRARRASVARQRLGGVTTADVVEIDPLAIVPLDADDADSPQMVEIVPIEVEPVRISQLESIAE
jgi:hypothetical protein